MKERREGVQEGRHYGIDRERERERERSHYTCYTLHAAETVYRRWEKESGDIVYPQSRSEQQSRAAIAIAIHCSLNFD